MGMPSLNSKNEIFMHEKLSEEGYELRKTGPRGEGIFATRTFVVGEIIMIGYILEVLSSNDSHASQIGENKFIRHGGCIKKVNHSCEPNCGIKINISGAHDVIARKVITSNEELTLDYAMRNYRIEYFPGQCLCGAPNCRGKITGWKDLPKERKKIYAGFIAPYLLELDKKYAQEAARVHENLTTI